MTVWRYDVDAVSGGRGAIPYYPVRVVHALNAHVIRLPRRPAPSQLMID